jgi:hypothetical protein
VKRLDVAAPDFIWDDSAPDGYRAGMPDLDLMVRRSAAVGYYDGEA